MPYFGGKITLGPTIADLMPEHRHYVEPYCGSLAVLLAKRPAPMETVNDLDGHLMTFWRVLRDRPAELERVCELTPHSRAEHAAAFNLPDELDDLEIARRVWVQLTQGRSSQRRSTSGWRQYMKAAGDTSLPDYLTGYARRIPPCAQRLHDVSLECMPALDIIAKYGAQPDALLYVDPPYPKSVRTKSSSAYAHEMRDDASHRELADAMHSARAAVVLSGYASELYDLELYAGWHRHTMSSATGQSGRWSARVEVLWSNRPIGAQRPLFEHAKTAHDS